MIAQRVFWGSTVLTAGLFTALFAASGVTVLAAVAVALGVLWLVADAKIDSGFGTVFFLAFVVLAVMASANDASLPLTLLGLSANLAAWDVSRLRTRLALEPDPERRAPVEARHVRVLAVTLAAGFLAALLPVVVRLTLPFVIMSGVTLLALLALYFAMRSLRADSDTRRPHPPH